MDYKIQVKKEHHSLISFDSFSQRNEILITTKQLGLLRNYKDCYLAPEGEKAKTRRERNKLENWLLKRGCNKESKIVAIGGGSLLDLAGFVAATFCRGIPFISVPTTLLAMTDAAIGGKVGINVGLKKNYLGAFHFPEKIIIDLSFLDSLPEEEFLKGMAEVIKHSLIGSRSLFTLIQENWENLLQKDILLPILKESILIKKTIVEEDPFEKGKRRLLNFGHTIGHALESASRFAMSHGEAVYRGMMGESFIAMKMGILPQGEFATILSFLEKRVGPIHLSSDKVKKALYFDKKNKEGKVRSVILEGIGQPLICSHEYVAEIPKEFLEEAIVISLRRY